MELTPYTAFVGSPAFVFIPRGIAQNARCMR